MNNNFIKEWAVPVVTGIILAIVIRLFILDVAYVRGTSMLPNFQSKDIVLVEKLSYHLHKPKIGDVVILPTPDKTENIIKRVVGLAGDTIEVKDGYLYRNGKKVEEKFIKEKMNKNEPFAKVTVPKGQIFVMGDNRNISADSRYFGTFKLSNIEGRVFFELYNNPFKTY